MTSFEQKIKSKFLSILANFNHNYGLMIIDRLSPEEIRLSISTGGWSDNETIINDLMGDILLYNLWVTSSRGGYHEFIVPSSWRSDLERLEDL